MQVHCHVIHEGNLILKDVPANATVNSIRNLLKQQSSTCKHAPVVNLILSGTVLADQPLSSLNISPPHYIVVHTAQEPLQVQSRTAPPTQSLPPNMPADLQCRWPSEDEIAIVQDFTEKQRERCIPALVIANHDPNIAVNLMVSQYASASEISWASTHPWVVRAMEGKLGGDTPKNPTDQFFHDRLMSEATEKCARLTREFSGSDIATDDFIEEVLLTCDLDDDEARKKLKEILGQ